MIRKQSKGSLADRIAGVLSAVPAQFNPDDDQVDDTTAKVTDFDDFNDEDDDEQLLSKFRKRNVDLLADVDSKYAGKKGSRKSLQADSSDEQSEVGSSDSEAGILGQDKETEFSDDDSEHDEDSNKDEDSLEQDSEGSDDEEIASESDNEGSIAISEEESNYQHMHETNVSQQVTKGLCVRNQMNIWENLLEVRIQLQKCLVAANKMPQASYYKEMVRESDPELSFKEKVKETNNSLGNALDKLLILQNLVMKKYPETKNLGKKIVKNNDNEDESDEEIPSDTEDELDNNENDSEEELKSNMPKRRKLNDYEKDIFNLHEKYKTYRNETIEKWNAKTRLSVTKNSGQPHSVVNHIEHILTDKEKLRKRTQIKKGEYKILGQADTEGENLKSSEDSGDIKQVEEYNTEIFDDNDFYHQLLRELIEVKSTDITDPVQLGRQWIQLQNLRSKMKRKIDTRATKGRKIRYAIHTKLVNFMAPQDPQTWTEEARNELYSSLFGKIQPKSVQSS